MNKPYTYKNGYLNLFRYTVTRGFVPCGKTSQEELHETAFKHANNVVSERQAQRQPANLFLRDVADPDEIPTKEEFEKWQKKRKVIDSLK